MPAILLARLAALAMLLAPDGWEAIGTWALVLVGVAAAIIAVVTLTQIMRQIKALDDEVDQMRSQTNAIGS